jgi:branched-chain amino acid transport system ATP-binding protein
LLEVQDLVLRFGGVVAIDGVSLAVPAGHVVGLIGPNGAGKTTLFNLITGVIPATTGTIMFESNNIAGRKPHEIVARGLSRTLQIKSVFGGMTVSDNIRIAVLAHMKIASPFWPAPSYRECTRRVEQLLEQTGLARLAAMNASQLSYGDVALLEIGLALANRPRLLLLDEPICGMSPGETEKTVERIKALARDTDIILIEHDMEVVFAISDHITVMAQGRLLAQGNAKEIAANAEVQEVYLGAPEDIA